LAQGGAGYTGTVIDLTDEWAVVELDDDLVLAAPDSVPVGWSDFGRGSDHALGHVPIAQGRWLALGHAWVGQLWNEPIGRLQVALCDRLSDIRHIPAGGGIGAWVEDTPP
jgi:hypothetical protein